MGRVTVQVRVILERKRFILGNVGLGMRLSLG